MSLARSQDIKPIYKKKSILFLCTNNEQSANEMKETIHVQFYQKNKI